MRDSVRDARWKVALCHIDGQVYRAGEAQPVGAAMAFHHDAVEPQKHAAVDGTRIHFVFQDPKRAAGEQIAKSRKQRPRHCGTDVVADEARGPFGGLQGDVAREARGYDHIDGTLRNVVAFDEAVEAQRYSGISERLGRGFYRLVAFHFFSADVEQADAWAIEPEYDPRIRFAQDCEIDQLARIRVDIRADIQHDGLPAYGRPDRGDGRPGNPFDSAQLKHRHRHEGTGIAGTHGNLRFLFADGIDRTPHGRIATAPQGL